MKSLRIVWTILFIFLAVQWLHADMIDPRIIVGGGVESDPVGSSFSFSSNTVGGGFFDFFNDSGEDWLNLLITVPTPTDSYGGLLISPGFYTIQSDFFSSVDLSFIPPSTKATTSIFFHGGILHDGEHFFIALNDAAFGDDFDPAGTGGWLKWQNNQSAPLDFSATANVPEPGTIVLLLGGMLVMGSRFALGKWQARKPH